MDASDFYSRDLWKHSPVYNSFVKLFIKDILALQSSPNEQNENTRFWLNHPIRWIQIVAIVVAIMPKENTDVLLRIAPYHTSLISVDDSSGATIEVVLSENEHRSMMPSMEHEEKKGKEAWGWKHKPNSLEVGDLIKVKGELRERWSIRRLYAMKLDVVTDQNVEIRAWEERIEFKRTVLSKPWKLPSSIVVSGRPRQVSNDMQVTLEPEKEAKRKPKPALRTIDFNNLPLAHHSIRNLKLLLLSHIKTLRRFTPKELFAIEHIQHAATCVTKHDQPKGYTDRDVTNNLLAALDLLLRDGNIIKSKPVQKENQVPLDSEMEYSYVVVGTWNLSTTIKSVAKRDNKVIVRDIWKKVESWGNGWETTTKGVVGAVVEEVLLGLQGQEWTESKPGVWIRVDV